MLLAQTDPTIPINLSFLVSASAVLSVLGAFLLYVLNASNSGVRKALVVRNAIVRIRDYILYSNQIQDARIANIESFLEKRFEYHSRDMPQIQPPDLTDLTKDDDKK